MIHRLKEELRAVTEDCEYYKSERDRFLDVLKKSPGWEQHLPRSPSPSSKRRSKSVHSVSTGGLSPGALSPTSPHSIMQMDLEPPPEGERYTRRRMEIDSTSLRSPHGQNAPQQSFHAYPPFSPHQTYSSSAPSPITTHTHRLPMVETELPPSRFERGWSSQTPNASR